MATLKRNRIRAYFFLGFFLAPLFLFSPAFAESNAVLINEVYYNVAKERGREGDDEWVELYNCGTGAVNLKNWHIADNKKNRLLSAVDLIVPAQSYVLISKSKLTWSKWNENADKIATAAIIELLEPIGNGLGNSGDRLTLYDAADQIADQISWGNDQSYFKLSAAKKGCSSERNDLCQDRDWPNDFASQGRPTPGYQWQKPTYSREVKLSEISPHPLEGSASEFIEIYNEGKTLIDLSGWTLVDASGKSYFTIKETEIAAGQYLVFNKEKTRLTLNDKGDMVRLADPNGAIASEVVYDSAKRGQGISLIDGFWQWTMKITPETQNILVMPESEDRLAILPIKQDNVKITSYPQQAQIDVIPAIKAELPDTGSGQTAPFYFSLTVCSLWKAFQKVKKKHINSPPA